MATRSMPGQKQGACAAMIRLFKLYIPNAVFLLALLDFALLIAAGELGWVVRAHQSL